MDIKYGLIVIKRDPDQETIEKSVAFYNPDDHPEAEGKEAVAVMHFVGYEEPPNDIDRRHFVEELKIHPEFVDIGKDLDKYEIVDAPTEVVEWMADLIGHVKDDGKPPLPG